MTCAAQYPDAVAGLVLLDSSTPEQFEPAGLSDTYKMLQRGCGIAPSVSRLGIGLLVPHSIFSSLPTAFRQAKAPHTLDASHAGLLDDRRAAGSSVSAIFEVIAAVRTHTRSRDRGRPRPFGRWAPIGAPTPRLPGKKQAARARRDSNP